MTHKTKPKRALDRRGRLALLLACLPFCWGHAQESISLDVPRIVPVSPEAAMMEKYRNYPVDHCTGVPEITVPLYEIQAGELTIPVTLSYHASGLKPKEESGVAGTGWTLNLKPSIMRQINGVADEETYGWFNRDKDWNEIPIDMEGKLEYYANKADNKWDTYPDKFIYRLPHGGGGGFFHWEQMPLWTSPRTNDRVEYHNASGMEITDEDGFRYSFTGTVEKSGDYTTRWMCDAVYSPRNGEQLATFSYWTEKSRVHPSQYYNLDNRLVFGFKRRTGDNRVMMFDEEGNRYYRLSPGENEYGEPEYEPSSAEECA